MVTQGPLAGIRVLELPAIGPVPFIGMLLADLGAEVIRVDRLQPLDDQIGQLPIGATGPLGRGRRSITLDLRSSEGAAVFLDLAEHVDIVIEGFRPGVAERLGIGPDVALARNPRLVYGRMTGWGQDGVLARTAGHDITYLAVAGLLHGMGPAAGPPTPPANLVGDFGGGAMSMAVGLLAALLAARTTGNGQVVDVAMVEGAAYLATMVRTLHSHGLWSDLREDNLFDGGSPNYRCYLCADGRFVAVGALEPKFWQVLVETLGLDVGTIGSPYDVAARDHITDVLSRTFLSKTRDEWAAIFQSLDGCVAPVLTLGEAPEHEHNSGRHAYIEVAGARVAAPPIRFGATPAQAADSAATIGADTEDLLVELGYSAERRAALRATGVTNQPDRPSTG
jgi:alpha-methylacyl-CoA racemase